MILYIKPGCPWCQEVLAYLDEEEFTYQTFDVSADSDALAEMKEIFDTTKAPSMIVGDDLKLADFGVDELVPFLEEHSIGPDDEE